MSDSEQLVIYQLHTSETVMRRYAPLQLYLNPNAEYILSWFHITMRLTVMNQTAKGLNKPSNHRKLVKPKNQNVNRLTLASTPRSGLGNSILPRIGSN